MLLFTLQQLRGFFTSLIKRFPAIETLSYMKTGDWGLRGLNYCYYCMNFITPSAAALRGFDVSTEGTY